MLLLDANTSLELMDMIINNETISHTEAKKLMIKQVKPAHRDLLLATLNYTEKDYSFSSYDNDSDLFGKKRTKIIIAKMYSKAEVLIAIEEYKSNTNNIKNKLNVQLVELKKKEEKKQKELELNKREQELKKLIENRAKEIMNQTNDKFAGTITISDNIDDMLNIFDELIINTVTYEEACNQAKGEILG